MLLLAPFIVCTLAVLLDRLLGEPSRLHPVVGFGRLVSALEKKCNTSPARPQRGVLAGLAALLLITLPILAVTLWLSSVLDGLWLIVAQAATAWLAMSLRGLAEHGQAVAEPLHNGDLVSAQEQVSRIVSRQASALDEQGVAAAATESMLENGADAVFATLFWLLVAGMPGVVLHRMVNTLDAMWGYRNPQFLYFGRAAARLDDILGWLPARLTALTYALLGNTKLAVECWRNQAPQWDSPNAGPVMAAGAGALNVRLGGPSPYPSGIKQRPLLGGTDKANAASIEAAIRLVRHGVVLWLAVIFVLSVLAAIIGV
ncbi:adenosylcobinamide-phosphate synthase CbiB [Pseudomonas sp. C27(2019)]|uniref:adenosylcobinamide-phosphate synthase CbiB n=1 Tax=Pseudomonas sp. C27(2019) TaxID=2604941 RepID=UPI003532073D